ncbi:MAG: enoyl-CoA hydratase [Gaiellaceae bacterium]|nr:enoyl-CoA hydratase [Gaiellaceae bacterium]
MTEEVVVYERRGPSAWITLNRPDKLNALNHALRDALSAALRRAEDDDEVRVVVLTGNGRAFSAGYDMSEEAAISLGSAAAWREELAADVDVTMQLWRLSKPTICLVRGWCLAGGLETAMAADLLLCTPDARFGEPEIRYGSGPVALLMPFVLNQRLTRELLFTGDTIDAEEALRAGLVNRIVAADQIEEEVSRLVARIAPTPLAVLKLTKQALNRAYLCMGLAEAVEANLDLSAILNSAGTPEQEQFDAIVRTEGLKAALAWRDTRYGEVLGTLGIKE